MYYKGEITHQEYEDETGETLLQQQVLYPAVNKMNIPPKGVYRKGTGTPRKQQAVRPQAAQGRGKGRATVILTVVYHRQPNMERGLILCRQ